MYVRKLNTIYSDRFNSNFSGTGTPAENLGKRAWKIHNLFTLINVAEE